MKKIVVIYLIIFGVVLSLYTVDRKNLNQAILSTTEEMPDQVMAAETHPLSIEYLRQQDYPGSEIEIDRELEVGSNYSRYLASYRSEGLKIFGLLTIPNGDTPETGWPVIIFNHGWIPPEQYVPWEKYVAYVDGFARNGYIVFRPDYRGHWESEGVPEGAYGSNAYSIDVLNAVSSMRRLEEADVDRIGMWGHSMGGFLTLRALVVDEEIKAAVIWGGVVGSYKDIYEKWWLVRARDRGGDEDIPERWRKTRKKIEELTLNTELLRELSANSFLGEVETPIQLHHAVGDETVPVVLSQDLANDLKDRGSVYEYYEYPGDDHNISENFSAAMERSIDFFDEYLKSNDK